jgi:hypothetical protein
MNDIWTIITIIGTVVVATGTVVGIYYNNNSKITNRLKELESKVLHHEKFIQIPEKRALDALEGEINP